MTSSFLPSSTIGNQGPMVKLIIDIPALRISLILLINQWEGVYHIQIVEAHHLNMEEQVDMIPLLDKRKGI